MIGKILFAAGVIGITALIIYIIAVVYVSFNQKKFIFLPMKTIETNPQVIGLEFDNIYFQTDDNETLHGWLIPSLNEKAVILFCHGNGGNISHRLNTIELLNKLNLSVFIFDYRGYGLSSGEPSEKGTYLDAKAAYDYLINEMKYTADKIIIMGRSLGGAIAIELATKKPVRGLIVESAFTSAGRLGQELLPLIPVKLLIKHKYNSVEKISGIDCPKLIVHSVDDDIIPFHHGEELFISAREPKYFLKIAGSHNDGFLTSGNTYFFGLKDFIVSLQGL